MAALPSIMPLTFAWIAFFPPEGTVATGVHGVDGAVFVNCMRMFETGFFTPYANCHAPLGHHASAYFAAPFFWMYGVLGALGRLIHANEFLLLGFANGVGGFLYLLAAYLFLRSAFPRQANLAFALFALAGGPGGVLYIATWALGYHGAPQFEQYFYRYALYQLFEGARPSPILAMPRLYYTVSMACCLGAITCFISAARKPSALLKMAAAALLFLGTLVNLRYGPMALGVLLLYLVADSGKSVRRRILMFAGLLMPVAIAWAIGWILLRRSPAFVSGTMETIRTHMWLSPFLSAMLFHLLVVPGQVMEARRSLPRLAGTVYFAALGYLLAYGVLYVLYNAYYGNLWLCLDVTSAAKISDVALIGAAGGVAWQALRNRARNAESPEDALRIGWVSLWLLCFLSIAISAFGQGWFMRLVPERAMIFLALPWAVLAAKGIQDWRAARPRVASALLAVMLACGICGIGVASACFQGPLGHRPGKGPYGYAHCELIDTADAELISKIDGGVVLAPVTYGPSFSDVLAVRPGVQVVYGFGSMNLGDREPAAGKDVASFFTVGCPESFRRGFVKQWCVKYVYCPGSNPVSEEVLQEFRRTSWMKEREHNGKAAVFEVMPAAQ